MRLLRDADTQNLNELAARRNQLITMLVAEKNRLERGTGSVHPRVEAHINWLEKELKDLDKDLRETLLRSPVWRQKDDLLRSVPGVGEQVSVSLLAYLPELGALDRKQTAALVGVVPIHRDSGILRGRRTVWGGRSRVRATLYMGTRVATRYNPVIRVFYQRLLVAGKAKKVALVASMRKLLTILNSMGSQVDIGILKRLHLDLQDSCFISAAYKLRDAGRSALLFGTQDHQKGSLQHRFDQRVDAWRQPKYLQIPIGTVPRTLLHHSP